ncbi:NAD(P)-dependent oxidoreductase, partial [Pseudoalteromonas sp. S1649]|uniref:NAD(P)-dependent oxidoreductase n=1 Tax=Pseudoalteromonas sp. S1649 TaxID=579508 RepID=UPI001281B0A6
LDDKPLLGAVCGDVSLRKCRAILNARAHVPLVAPEFCDELRELAEKGDVTLINDFFKAQYLDQQMLVIAETDLASFNKDVF